MISALAIGVAGLSTALCYSHFQGFRRNLALAKASGLPYVIVPWHIAGVPWLLLQPLLLPVLESLPESWTIGWLPFLHFGTGWNHGYEPFKLVGRTTFIAISPSQNTIHTCDPDVSSQIFKRSEFGKPVELITLLNVFGPGLTGSDGLEGRLYRKITAPFFTEQTMDRAWRTSYETAGVLMQGLSQLQYTGPSRNLRSVIASMTIHNLVSVLFPLGSGEFQLQEKVPSDRRLSLTQAVLSILDHIAMVAFTPRLILKYLPLGSFRKANLCYFELGTYLERLSNSAFKRSTSPELSYREPSLIDLMHQANLPPSAVHGNTFSFMFAGHEANANTLILALFLLACHPETQQSVQQTIDGITSRDDHSASYSHDFPILAQSIVAAVVNETLRLFTILPFLPKKTPSTSQTISIDGKPHTLPANTLILINTSATHRHPQYWPSPTAKTKVGIEPYPVSSFDPDFWLHRDAIDPQYDTVKSQANTEFLQPKHGSFVPFSDGSRGCLGKRFAMVELCAQMMRIFAEWSVELVLEDGEDWKQARRRAEEKLSRGVAFDLTLRPKEMVNIRFVRRAKPQAKDS